MRGKRRETGPNRVGGAGRGGLTLVPALSEPRPWRSRPWRSFGLDRRAVPSHLRSLPRREEPFSLRCQSAAPLWHEESRHDRPARSSSWANLSNLSPSCEGQDIVVVVIILVQQLSIKLPQYHGYFPTLAPMTAQQVENLGSPQR